MGLIIVDDIIDHLHIIVVHPSEILIFQVFPDKLNRRLLVRLGFDFLAKKAF